jgi:hypothetical protein
LETQYAPPALGNLGSSIFSRIRQDDAQAPLMNGPKLGTQEKQGRRSGKYLVDQLRQSSRKKLILEPNGVRL